MESGSGELEPSEELRARRQEVQILRQRLAELRRRIPRHRDDEPSRQQGAVVVTVSAREELLLETERLAHVGSWVLDVQTDGVFWSDEMYRILGYDQERDPPSREGFFARVRRPMQTSLELLEEAQRIGVRS